VRVVFRSSADFFISLSSLTSVLHGITRATTRPHDNTSQLSSRRFLRFSSSVPTASDPDTLPLQAVRARSLLCPVLNKVGGVLFAPNHRPCLYRRLANGNYSISHPGPCLLSHRSHLDTVTAGRLAPYDAHHQNSQPRGAHCHPPLLPLPRHHRTECNYGKARVTGTVSWQCACLNGCVPLFFFHCLLTLQLTSSLQVYNSRFRAHVPRVFKSPPGHLGHAAHAHSAHSSVAQGHTGPPCLHQCQRIVRLKDLLLSPSPFPFNHAPHREYSRRMDFQTRFDAIFGMHQDDRDCPQYASTSFTARV